MTFQEGENLSYKAYENYFLTLLGFGNLVNIVL